MGKHHSHDIHRDPWAFLQLLANYDIVKETAPYSILGVYPGGRLPLLVHGLLLGSQWVRVGKVDISRARAESEYRPDYPLERGIKEDVNFFLSRKRSPLDEKT